MRFLAAVLVLVAVIVSTCGPIGAAQIRTYDIDSLCYMSTDVVVATIERIHVSGQNQWQDAFTATVLSPIEGSYAAGDKIPGLFLELYNPAPSGQRAILFIERNDYSKTWSAPHRIQPRSADMLLVDDQGRVRRYFQWNNPGGLVAEGYNPYVPGGLPTSAPVDDQHCPTLSDEIRTIQVRWAAVEKLRPILDHDPAQADVQPLLDLLQDRCAILDGHGRFHKLVDGISEAICSRLSTIGNPDVKIEALGILKDQGIAWTSGLAYSLSARDRSYIRAVLIDTSQPLDRRRGALLALSISYARDKPTIPLDQASFAAVLSSSDTPDELKVATIPLIDIEQPQRFVALRDLYCSTKSEEIKFDIELAVVSRVGYSEVSGLARLDPNLGSVTSIVRQSPTCAVKAGYLCVETEVVRLGETSDLDLTKRYSFTLMGTHELHPVDLGKALRAGRSITYDELPIPRGLRPGEYTVALSLCENGRAISTGHYLIVMLPLTRN